MKTTQSAKAALRVEILAARRLLPPSERRDRAAKLADVLLAMPQIHDAQTIAAYVSVGTEPGTAPLLDALRGASKRVLLPVLLPDNDLDWALHDGALSPATRGLMEPAGPSLGLGSIATADLVVVPALAIGRDGTRLGRGGGSYDRALARATGVIVGVVNSEEVLDLVPSDPHDQRVHAIATPDGVVRVLT